MEAPYSIGYNGVDYFSPESVYVVGPADLGWRLDVIDATLASFGKPAMTQTRLRPGINQLKCPVDLCHLHGIAVIFDLVSNHAGPNSDDQRLRFYDRQTNGNQNNSLYFTDQSFGGGQVFAYGNDWVAEFLIDNG
jgi:1,4-alpha-glucan branching enzyme